MEQNDLDSSTPKSDLVEVTQRVWYFSEDQERKARIRNKYRLLEKWNNAIEQYNGPGEAVLIDDYRPSGYQAPVDVPEIAGLVIKDTQGTAHLFRLYRDERVVFLRMTDDEKITICIDPWKDFGANTKIYESDGLPQAVEERIELLEVTPNWSDACAEGKHDFELTDKYSRTEINQCIKCEHFPSLLSWLGQDMSRFKD